jgi:hypothetical protein
MVPMTRMDVTIHDTDSTTEIARKLSEALNWAHELRGAAMVWYRGEQVAMIVPPNAGLAWAHAEEAARLSDIATAASGIAPSGMPAQSLPRLRPDRF